MNDETEDNDITECCPEERPLSPIEQKLVEAFATYSSALKDIEEDIAKAVNQLLPENVNGLERNVVVVIHRAGGNRYGRPQTANVLLAVRVGDNKQPYYYDFCEMLLDHTIAERIAEKCEVELDKHYEELMELRKKEST
jgi:hypothetical protein